MPSHTVSLSDRGNCLPISQHKKQHSSNTSLSMGRSAEDTPSPPMVMASDTPTVLNCQPSMPSFSTAAFTILPRSWTRATVSHVSGTVPQSSQPTVSAAHDQLQIIRTQGNANLLARVPLPPYRRDAHMRCRLHHIAIRHAGSVEHSLGSVSRRSTSGPAPPPGLRSAPRTEGSKTNKLGNVFVSRPTR